MPDTTKTVLITGASSGIGKATTAAFARKGWNVAATMRTVDAQKHKEFPHVRSYELDVTDTNAIERTFAQAEKDFGPIYVVVNNAGYAADGVFESIDKETIQKQFDTNVFGLMEVTREAIKSMRRNSGGTIIQVASMGGRLTFPTYSIYHASKWAVEGFSESLYYELRQFNIRIKIIEPGVIRTDFYGAGRAASKDPLEMGYDDFIQKVERVSGSAGQSGEDPSVVADAIFAAATDQSSRLRYVVGSPAPLLLTLRKILPERVFLYLLRKQYHI